MFCRSPIPPRHMPRHLGSHGLRDGGTHKIHTKDLEPKGLHTGEPIVRPRAKAVPGNPPTRGAGGSDGDRPATIIRLSHRGPQGQ
jgi:hypothetical protein